MVKKLRSLTNREEAAVLLVETKAYLDRLAGKRIIHRNTAANYKSQLEKSVNAVS